jgi:hypothetical protein
VPLHQLAVAPADVDGTRLGLALNEPAPPLLASSRLHHPEGGALLLGVLGASHVVIVEGHFSEQVSCTAGGDGVSGVKGGDLPARADAGGYHLESRTATHDETTFRRLARQLRDDCAQKTGWLGGVFPGDDAALTALAGEPDGAGWRWQTWHLYPGHPAGSGGTVVHTTSRWRP